MQEKIEAAAKQLMSEKKLSYWRAVHKLSKRNDEIGREARRLLKENLNQFHNFTEAVKALDKKREPKP